MQTLEQETRPTDYGKRRWHRPDWWTMLSRRSKLLSAAAFTTRLTVVAISTADPAALQQRALLTMVTVSAIVGLTALVSLAADTVAARRSTREHTTTAETPARPAPATPPHTRLSAALGIAAAAAGLSLLVAVRLDADRRMGERLLTMATLGGLLGLGYLATRLRWREAIRPAREAYWLGRMSVMLERAATRRPSRLSGRTHAEP